MSDLVALTLSGRAPGDLVFTRGDGALGWLVRRASGAHYGHVGVLHACVGLEVVDGNLMENWLTVEAWPSLKKAQSGPKYRTRLIPVLPNKADAHKLRFLRVSNTVEDVEDLLWVSDDIATSDIGYGFAELARIAIYGFPLLARVLSPLLSRWTDKASTMVCSHHAAICVLAARPDAAAWFPYPAHQVWPGLLRECLASMLERDDSC